MPSTNFTAANRDEILNQLYIFATANGWTGQYNVTNPLRNIAISSGNCLISIGESGAPTVFTDSLGNSITDARIRFGLNSAFTASQNFNGHTRGDNGLNDGNDDFPLIFDTGGTTTVYLYTDGGMNPDYLHGMIRASDGLRWSGFSFGQLYAGDFTVPRVAYLVVNRFQFWFNSSDPTNSNSIGNDVENLVHAYIGRLSNYNVRIPSGVLDTNLGFPSGDNVFSDNRTGGNDNLNVFVLSNLRPRNASRTFDEETGICQGYLNTKNQLITGGAPLWFVPFLIRIEPDDFLTYLGDIPDMRLCDMRTFGALQNFQQGSDTWTAFPWCRIGQEINARFGSIPLSVTNSTFYGQAIKVIP